MVLAPVGDLQHTEVSAPVACSPGRRTNPWSMVGEHPSSQARHCACESRSETSPVTLATRKHDGFRQLHHG